MHECKNVLTMTDSELDNELRENGIDPEVLIQHAFQKVCVLARAQAERISSLAHQLSQEKERWEEHTKRRALPDGDVSDDDRPIG